MAAGFGKAPLKPSGNSKKGQEVEKLKLAAAAKADVKLPPGAKVASEESLEDIFAKVTGSPAPKSKAAAALSGPAGMGARPEPLAPALSGGGAVHEDYATFPALDPKVTTTCQAAPAAAPSSAPPGPLPFDVLDQLAAVYGFSNFDGDVPSDAAFSDPNADADAAAAAACRFPGVKLLHADPMVLAVDHFLTAAECEAMVAQSDEGEDGVYSTADAASLQAVKVSSATLGKDAAAQAQRTSTTWFHRYSSAAPLLAKACALLGTWRPNGQSGSAKDGDDDLAAQLARFEEPQTVRYRGGERFTWHLDALPPSPGLAAKGGQRVATVLVYLQDLPPGAGGATAFRDLGPGGPQPRSAEGSAASPLEVQPKQGTALVFFPSAGGLPNAPFDVRTLHAGLPVDTELGAEKWIAQLWLRESAYAPTAPPGNAQAAAADAVRAYAAAQPAKGAWL